MMTARNNFYYKVQYSHQGDVLELYVRQIAQSNIWGFIEISGIEFEEHHRGVTIDAAEEKLKNEFSGVTCSYIPIHHIIRIDRVTQLGSPKVSPSRGKSSNVTPFTTHLYHPKNPEGND